VITGGQFWVVISKCRIIGEALRRYTVYINFRKVGRHILGRVVFIAQVGGIYNIVVGGFGGATGNVYLSLTSGFAENLSWTG